MIQPVAPKFPLNGMFFIDVSKLTCCIINDGKDLDTAAPHDNNIVSVIFPGNILNSPEPPSTPAMQVQRRACILASKNCE